MYPHQPKTVVCECCDLDVHERYVSPVVNAYQLNRGWRCRKCNEHQGDALKMAKDHEHEVRVRWGETVDELHRTQDLADEYRKKMRAAFQSRDSILRRFEELKRYHHATTHGCVCGKRNCQTLAIVDDDWINDRIAAMYKAGPAG